MSLVFYLDLANVLSLTFLYFLTPFSIFPPNHLFTHAAPESRLLKLFLFQSPFLISAFPMATFQSLIFLTSVQHCWPRLLHWLSSLLFLPGHKPFLSDYFLALLTNDPSVLFSGCHTLPTPEALRLTLLLHYTLSLKRSLIYFMVLFATYGLKLPTSLSPLNCLLWFQTQISNSQLDKYTWVPNRYLNATC